MERDREELLKREQASRQQLDAAVRARDEFVAVAAHELRNPLNVLHLTLQMLNRACREPQDFSRVTAIAAKSQVQLGRFTELVDRLLDVTRARSGTFDLYREQFNLSTLIAEIADRFRQEDSTESIELAMPSEIRGIWDRFRIDQVVTNLISNAIKFGSQAPITVTASVEEGHAVIRVKDRGTGVLPEDLPRIFDLFERGTSDPQKKSGLGVGLWLTKQIVEAHQRNRAG